jgi:competence protein ComEA
MNRWLKELFSFSRGERNGLLVMVSIIIMLIILRLGLPFFVHPPVAGSYASAIIKELPDSLKEVDTYRTDTIPEIAEQLEVTELFPFDPNTTGREELIKLGFSSFQARNITKYIEKGGRFLHREDLKRVYGITNEQYSRVEPFIRIIPQKYTGDSSHSSKKKFFQYTSQKQPLNIELNSADSSLLVALNGIGPALAGRIIKYREKLGGFCRPEQLQEVYGMSQETIELIRPFITVDSARIRPIQLNAASLKELEDHPYLDRYQSQAIIKYRQVRTKFLKVEEVYENRLLSQEQYQKIRPYLRAK